MCPMQRVRGRCLVDVPPNTASARRCGHCVQSVLTIRGDHSLETRASAIDRSRIRSRIGGGKTRLGGPLLLLMGNSAPSIGLSGTAPLLL